MAKKNSIEKTIEKTSSISGKLLRFLIPMVAVAIAVMILFVSGRASNIITSLSEDALSQEAEKNAQTLGTELQSAEKGFDSAIDIIEDTGMTDSDAILSVLTSAMTFSKSAPTGIYMALDDGTYLDPSGWTPGPDYVAADRPWYKSGSQNDTFYTGIPYFDQNTNSMVVPLGRKVNLSDGRIGVASSDYQIGSITETVAQYTPMGSGQSMLLDGGSIISYTNTEFNGTAVDEHADDTFLTAIHKGMENATNKVAHIKNGKNTYYVAYTPVPGTSWTLVSYVTEATVLAEVKAFRIICYILMVVMILVIGFVMWYLIRNIVSKPVGALTNSIISIANNDFTVEIKEGGTDEMGRMGNSMRGYVSKMRETLSEIKNITGNLSNQAENSKSASGILTTQAKQQSDSMVQIKETLDNMNDAVAELAENATTLAGEVTDLMEQGNTSNKTVAGLAEKAKAGQHDMESVRDSMRNISLSMGEMNDEVNKVSESTNQITSIVEMINSIASQTNLLSLNASIEAARAGEAGKGFAVVASEIGKLANDSAESATQIGNIISDVTEQINHLAVKSNENMESINQSVGAVDTAGETFATISSDLNQASQIVQSMIDKIGTVDTIATSVAAISEEQSASTEEVTTTIDGLVESADQVAAESQGVENAANTVSDSATSIEDFISGFKLN